MVLSDSGQFFNDKSRLPGMLEEIDIRLLWAQRDDLPPGGWDHPRLTNDFWRLYQNDSDGGWLESDDGGLMLEPGAVYLVPSGLTLSSRNESRIAQLFVHFDLRGVPPIAFRELFPGPVQIPHTPLFCAAVADLGARIARSGSADVAVQCITKGIVYEAFGHYLDALSPDLLERCWLRVSALRPVLPALAWIQERLDQQVTNAELAALCSLSEDHFIRRFRDAVGFSPAQYVLKRRVALAAQHLLFTTLSIDQIADRTGFGDRFYFSRVFARETGRPPAAYRRGPRI